MRYSLTQDEITKIINTYSGYTASIKIIRNVFFTELEKIYLKHNFIPLQESAIAIKDYWEKEAYESINLKLQDWIESENSIEHMLYSIDAFDENVVATQAAARELQDELVSLTLETFKNPYNFTLINDSVSMEEDLKKIFEEFKDSVDFFINGVGKENNEIKTTFLKYLDGNDVLAGLIQFIDYVNETLITHISYVRSLLEDFYDNIINKMSKSLSQLSNNLSKDINNPKDLNFSDLFGFSDVPISNVATADENIEIIFPTQQNKVNNHKSSSAVNNNLSGGSGTPSGLARKNQNSLLKLYENEKVYSIHRYNFQNINGVRSIVYEWVEGKPITDWNEDEWEYLEEIIPESRNIPGFISINKTLNKIPNQYPKKKITWQDIHHTYFIDKNDDAHDNFPLTDHSFKKFYQDEYDINEYDINEYDINEYDINGYVIYRFLTLIESVIINKKIDGDANKIYFQTSKITDYLLNLKINPFKPTPAYNDSNCIDTIDDAVKDIVKKMVPDVKDFVKKMVPDVKDKVRRKIKEPDVKYKVRRKIKEPDVKYKVRRKIKEPDVKDKFRRKIKEKDITVDYITKILEEYVSYIHEMGHLIGALSTGNFKFKAIVAKNILITINDRKEVIISKTRKLGNVCICDYTYDISHETATNDYLLYNRGSLISKPFYKYLDPHFNDNSNLYSKLGGKFSSDLKMEEDLCDSSVGLEKVQQKIDDNFKNINNYMKG
ncbi:hypothetical protein ACTQ54_02325 [Fundicoccus sp. Sow4_H7]|uniref:hypothetical protein n=1 Tax=Fundicoccus sp. Sow4_H7 TaxID=3438784 RepID=UPI003F8F70EA